MISDTKHTKAPLVKQGRFQTKSVSNRTYLASVVFSILGFSLALVGNLIIPQISQGITIKEYLVGSITLTMNQAYGLVLVALILFYLGIGVFSFFGQERRAHFKKRAAFRFALGIALLLWDILGTKYQILPQPFFPGPAGIVEAFLMEGAYIWENTLYSLRLFAVGFSIGVLFGVSTGILIGWFPKVHYWAYPVLKISGVIPAVAWMPFALTLFPTPFAAAVFLIVICAWFPVASMTASGIQSTPKAQFEAARTLGGKTPFLVFRVAIPHAMPQIFTGIITANAFAFVTLVIAEMMGQPGGLGYYINASKVWSAYYKVFAAILVMAILFSLIMKGVSLLQDRVLRWQKGLIR